MASPARGVAAALAPGRTYGPAADGHESAVPAVF